MPFYDRACTVCGEKLIDCYEPMTPPSVACKCGEPTQRVWIPGSANSIIGDEIDVHIRHGLCHADGTPRHFTSREHLKRVEKAAGQTNYVVHQGTKGGDKSKFTSRWI